MSIGLSRRARSLNRLNLRRKGTTNNNNTIQCNLRQWLLYFMMGLAGLMALMPLIFIKLSRENMSNNPMVLRSSLENVNTKQHIVILPGPHKTGTTSIQWNLLEWTRQRHMLGNWIWPVVLKETPVGDVASLMREIQKQKTNSQSPNLNLIEMQLRFRRQFQKQWRQGRSIVFGHEEMDRILRDGDDQIDFLLDLMPWVQHPKFLQDYSQRQQQDSLSQFPQDDDHVWEHDHDDDDDEDDYRDYDDVFDIPKHIPQPQAPSTTSTKTTLTGSISQNLLVSITYRYPRVDQLLSVWHEIGTPGQSFSEFVLQLKPHSDAFRCALNPLGLAAAFVRKGVPTVILDTSGFTVTMQEPLIQQDDNDDEDEYHDDDNDDDDTENVKQDLPNADKTRIQKTTTTKLDISNVIACQVLKLVPCTPQHIPQLLANPHNKYNHNHNQKHPPAIYNKGEPPGIQDVPQEVLQQINLFMAKFDCQYQSSLKQDGKVRLLHANMIFSHCSSHKKEQEQEEAYYYDLDHLVHAIKQVVQNLGLQQK